MSIHIFVNFLEPGRKRNGPRIAQQLFKRSPSRCRKPWVQGVVEHGTKPARCGFLRKRKDSHRHLRVPVVNNVELVAADGLTASKKIGIFPHRTVKHSELEWVRGIVHTNTVEGFSSLLNLQLIRTHQQVSIKHLHRYLNKSGYKFNWRKEVLGTWSQQTR